MVDKIGQGKTDGRDSWSKGAGNLTVIWESSELCSCRLNS
jgi:hypothetical protein